MNPQSLVDIILDENRNLLAGVSEAEVNRLIETLDNAERVFCAAQGRSGFILRCFCMRLMQLGYPAFFVGETITPRIRKGDVLFVLSGSGQTALTQEWVRLAREQGAMTVGIVGVEDSPIGSALHHRLFLPGALGWIQPEGLARFNLRGLCLSKQVSPCWKPFRLRYTRNKEAIPRQYGIGMRIWNKGVRLRAQGDPTLTP